MDRQGMPLKSHQTHVIERVIDAKKNAYRAAQKYATVLIHQAEGTDGVSAIALACDRATVMGRMRQYGVYPSLCELAAMRVEQMVRERTAA